MTGADGSESIEHRTCKSRITPTPRAALLFHVLHTELRVNRRPSAARQNERARAWLKFSGKPASIVRFFDIRNAQTMWLNSQI